MTGIPSPRTDRPPERILAASEAETLYGLLPGFAEAIAQEIIVRVPAYARQRDSTYADTVLWGVRKSVYDFVNDISGRHDDAGSLTEAFRQIGRGEAQLERGLDTLQDAMLIGVEVMWRQLSAACLTLGMGDKDLCLLGDALLVHFRKKMLAAADGHAEVHARLTSEAQRHRRHLLELVLSEPPVSPTAVAKVAAAAKWQLPETVAAVALGDRGADEFGSLDLPPDILVDLNRSQPCLLVPEPGRRGRLRMLEAALHGCAAAVGPPLPLTGAANSLRWAREAVNLAERGLISGTGVIHCVEHMATLVIFQNEDLIDALAGLRLAPLAGLRSAQRERLAETLLAWLQTGGDACEVATELHVHPQTVRYRVRQLREVFGDSLRDPDVQLELAMVLRWRQLHSRARTAARGRRLPAAPRAPQAVSGR